MSDNSLPTEGSKLRLDLTKKPHPSNESCNSNPEGASKKIESDCDLSLNTEHKAIRSRPVSPLTVNLNNNASQKRTKKQGTRAAKPGRKPKWTSPFKANPKELPPMTDPYFNFLRAFRTKNRKKSEEKSVIRQATLFWGDLSPKKRSLFEPESLKRGVSALSFLNHLEHWKAKPENIIDRIRTNNDDDIDNEDACGRKKRRSCRKKKPSCSRRKKRSCGQKRRKKKKRSCRPKRRSCKRKKRSCQPKKRACPPKPKCRPKRRC